jgi:hypothetical protein
MVFFRLNPHTPLGKLCQIGGKQMNRASIDTSGTSDAGRPLGYFNVRFLQDQNARSPFNGWNIKHRLSKAHHRPSHDYFAWFSFESPALFYYFAKGRADPYQKILRLFYA